MIFSAILKWHHHSRQQMTASDRAS